MHCQDIAENAMEEGSFTSSAKRLGAPGWQLLSRVQKDIKKREEQNAPARFTNPAKGYIGLAEWARGKSLPASSKKMPTIVYVASNPAMEGLLKIGITGNINARMKSLYRTNVPSRFDCKCAVEVDNAADIEKKLLRLLKHRVNPNREFFRLPLDDLVPFLQGLGKDVTPAASSSDSHGAAVSPADVQSGRRNQRILPRRPLLRFSKIGIRSGATLTANRRGSDEKCKVVRDNVVIFRGKEMTWTNATKRLLGNPKWQPQPARHWQHKGKLLVDIYNEKYSPA